MTAAYRCALTSQVTFPWASVTVFQSSTKTASPVTGSMALRSAFLITAFDAVVRTSRFTSEAATVTIADHLDGVY